MTFQAVHVPSHACCWAPSCTAECVMAMYRHIACELCDCCDVQVLLERLNMLIDEGSCMSAAATPTAAAGPTASATGPTSSSSFFEPWDKHPTGCRAWHNTAQPSAGTQGPAAVTAAAAAAAHHSWHHSSNASDLAASHTKHSSSPAAAAASRPASAAAAMHTGRPASAQHHNTTSNNKGPSGSSFAGGTRKQQQPGTPKKPVRGLIEVSTSGGLAQSVMQSSAQTVLDELDVTLG